MGAACTTTAQVADDQASRSLQQPQQPPPSTAASAEPQDVLPCEKLHSEFRPVVPSGDAFYHDRLLAKTKHTQTVLSKAIVQRTGLMAEHNTSDSNRKSQANGTTRTTALNVSSTFYKLPSEVVAKVMLYFVKDENTSSSKSEPTRKEYEARKLMDDLMNLSTTFIDAVVFDDYLWKQVKPQETFHYNATSHVARHRERLLRRRLEIEPTLLCDCSLLSADALLRKRIAVKRLKIWLPIAQFNAREACDCGVCLRTLHTVPEVSFMYTPPEFLQQLCAAAGKSIDGGQLHSIKEVSLVQGEQGAPLVLSQPLLGLRKFVSNGVHAFTNENQLLVFFTNTPNLRHLNVARGRKVNLDHIVSTLHLLEELYLGPGYTTKELHRLQSLTFLKVLGVANNDEAADDESLKTMLSLKGVDLRHPNMNGFYS